MVGDLGWSWGLDWVDLGSGWVNSWVWVGLEFLWSNPFRPQTQPKPNSNPTETQPNLNEIQPNPTTTKPQPTISPNLKTNPSRNPTQTQPNSNPNHQPNLHMYKNLNYNYFTSRYVF